MKRYSWLAVFSALIVTVPNVFAQQTNNSRMPQDTTALVQDTVSDEENAEAAHAAGFILLESGNKKDGTVERIEEPFGRSYLLLNGTERYSLSSVRAYENGEGYFARLYRSPWEGDFVRRVSTGKIDLFASTEWAMIAVPTHPMPTPDGPMMMHRREMIAVDNVSYFSKNGIDVLAINYQNLSEALADNPASMKCLKEYRNLEIWQWALLGVGTVMAIVGLSNSKQDDREMSPWTAAGCVVAATAWIPYSMKGPKLQLAIDLYNR